MTEYRVNLNLNGPHLAFHARSLQILERSTLALQSVVAASAHDGMVPGVSGPSLAIRVEPRPLDVVRPEVSSWIVGCTLRDWLEELSLFLVEVRRCCAMIGAFQGFDVPVRSEDFNDLQRETEQFDRLGFPGKIAALRDEFGDVVGDGWERVETLVKVRNCLVHRLGLVTVRDVNQPDVLVVRWQTISLAIQNPGKPEAIALPGTIVQPGGSIVRRVHETERRFALGSRIELTTGDLCDIWQTLIAFCESTARCLFDSARKRGMVAPEVQ